MLDTLISICHVDKAIALVGKDKELVKFVMTYFFANCKTNVRLQRKLFKFVHLVACEIQTNPESDWIRHLKNHNCSIENNTIAILMSTFAGRYR